MNQTYFLGANSKAGFASLYAGFPPEPGQLLHILKGGPGTGKSGFMRRIGRAAEARGLAVHTVLCSGDPDSLDGLWIPALGQAWADGTAPHVLEPRSFGVDADYVNLGVFFQRPFLEAEKAAAVQLSGRYKALYAEAYRDLAAAGALEEPERAPDPGLLGQAMALLPAEAAREGGASRESARFLSALSCQGTIRLTGEIEKLCKLIVQVERAALPPLLEETRQRGLAVIRCPSPLSPERPEALLLPEASLALVDESWDFPAAERLCAPARPAVEAPLRKDLLAMAMEALRRGKALHDELEELYKAHMDFPALTEYTDETIERLFP